MSEVSIHYRVLTTHKNSVRIMPTEPMLTKFEGCKLPDIYITHDLLDEIGYTISERKNVRLLVTFSREE